MNCGDSGAPTEPAIRLNELLQSYRLVAVGELLVLGRDRQMNAAERLPRCGRHAIHIDVGVIKKLANSQSAPAVLVLQPAVALILVFGDHLPGDGVNRAQGGFRYLAEHLQREERIEVGSAYDAQHRVEHGFMTSW